MEAAYLLLWCPGPLLLLGAYRGNADFMVIFLHWAPEAAVVVVGGGGKHSLSFSHTHWAHKKRMGLPAGQVCTISGMHLGDAHKQLWVRGLNCGWIQAVVYCRLLLGWGILMWEKCEIFWGYKGLMIAGRELHKILPFLCKWDSAHAKEGLDPIILFNVTSLHVISSHNFIKKRDH